MKATLVRTEKLNEQVYSFWFEPERRFRYIAGQFIEITLPHDNADDRGTRRWFTLSSSPTEELLAITTRFSHQGSSFKRTLHELQLNDVVEISEPMGDFVLPKDTSSPLFFVAGGMGITPYRSMAKWLADTKESRNVQMIYSLKEAADEVFREVFAAAGIEPTLFITGHEAHAQHLRAHDILNAIQDDQTILYISGPEPMVENLEKQLKTAGFPANRLVLDFFPGYQPI
ncbi:MAG: FAD-dependent oxidoreductase [Candidatus Saccharibacteria bacterium]|nr:FAD-dependent oxidoreductase [Candidatus Saccharibacteria bacterium]